MGHVQPQFLPVALLRVAADQVIRPAAQGFGGLFPDHELEGIPSAVGPHAVKLTDALAGGVALARGAGLSHWQWRRGGFGGRVHQQLGGRPPVGPHAEGAQRKACLGHQGGHGVQASPLGLKRNVHHRLPLCGHICPGPVVVGVGRWVIATVHGDANAIPWGGALAGELHLQRRAAAHELRLGLLQMQRQPAQRGVADVHANHGAARQHEGEQVAQVELEVDGGNEQHHQRHRQHPSRAGGQDVDVALCQLQGVGAFEAPLPPRAKAPPQCGGGRPACQPARCGWGRGSGGHHASGTASTMARTCSTAPRPASPTGTSRWAMVWGSTACTSSGAT